ncbi:hypothetical protein [Enterobacter ludwigii]|jgi:hypothetical protein|uniref:hypothetical protein n=1 Tax=Enterobacter ludwigii TaxID=299767 RepID=UPI0013D0A44E|nr:hypothetical protein [Enterobacter ludwigii]
MKGHKLLAGVLFFGVIPLSWGVPQAGDYRVKVSNGPFAKNISLSDIQQHNTDKWKHIMQRELVKPVNFAGHYRLYLSKNGELPKECGDERWVCGWIIDKTTGQVVSELPEFNGNNAYYSYHDNGTPVSEDFAPDFYPISTMLWMNGETAPRSNPDADKCNYISYNFTKNTFTTLLVGEECEVKHGNWQPD